MGLRGGYRRSSAVSGVRASRRNRLRLDKFEPHSPRSLTLSGGSGMGLRGGYRRSSAVSGVRASRRNRLRLDKFEPHSPRSLTLSGGSGIRTHVVTGTNALAGRRF